MNELDRRIINELQGGFPICERPFQQVAEQLDTTEAVLLERITSLCEQGLISRFGPLFNAEAMGGGATLAAMVVPEDRIEEVAQRLAAKPEVAHNYLREHELNMWFVVLTERAEDLPAVLADIAEESGLRVYNMPKQEQFFLRLKLEV